MPELQTAFSEPTINPSIRQVEDDRHLDRYGFNAGPDIDLSRMSGSQYVGDFPGEIIFGRRLQRIMEARSLGPFEVPATIIHGDAVVQSGPSFTVGSEGMVPPPTTSMPDALTRSQNRNTQFRNSPKACAYILMRMHESKGLVLLEGVKGWPTQDVIRAYSLFMPVTARGAYDNGQLQSLKWDMEREVNGIKVQGPFLDQVRFYLREGGEAATRLKAAAGSGKATAEQINAAATMLKMMRGACDVGWAFFNTHLNNEEAAIKQYEKGKPGKRDYDLPDGRFSNGVMPMDIQALANTNRDPMEVRATREQSRQMEENNSVLMRGFELMGEKMAALQPKAVTAEDVAKMLAERDAMWEERIANAQKPPAGGN